MLYKVVLTFGSVDEILKCEHQMKAIEQYFPVVLFIVLYKVVLFLSLWMKSYSVTTQTEVLVQILRWCCSFFAVLQNDFSRTYIFPLF